MVSRDSLLPVPGGGVQGSVLVSWDAGSRLWLPVAGVKGVLKSSQSTSTVESYWVVYALKIRHLWYSVLLGPHMWQGICGVQICTQDYTFLKLRVIMLRLIMLQMNSLWYKVGTKGVSSTSHILWRHVVSSSSRQVLVLSPGNNPRLPLLSM